MPHIKTDTGCLFVSSSWVTSQLGEATPSRRQNCALYARESSSEHIAASPLRLQACGTMPPHRDTRLLVLYRRLAQASMTNGQILASAIASRSTSSQMASIARRFKLDVSRWIRAICRQAVRMVAAQLRERRSGWRCHVMMCCINRVR